MMYSVELEKIETRNWSSWENKNGFGGSATIKSKLTCVGDASCINKKETNTYRAKQKRCVDRKTYRDVAGEWWFMH